MDELVSSVHLGFLFYELLEDARVERGPKGGKWNLDFLDPVLVWRVCRLCILVDHHRFLVLHFLHLLDVWRLKRHDSMQVQPCLELDTREVAAGTCGDTLGNKPGDPRVNTTRQAVKTLVEGMALPRGKTPGSVSSSKSVSERSRETVLGVELAYTEGGAEECVGKGHRGRRLW